VDQRSLFCSFA